MKILAVIPARGGSKGIPRKNIRMMNGKPLIAYAITNALDSHYISDVVVTTDSDEIAYVSEIYGAEVIRRTSELATDDITLDPVVFDAVKKTEKKNGYNYDYVVTMQPTSPLLKIDSLDGAISKIISENKDVIISVVNKPHLSWKKEGDRIVANYEERLNRQQLPANYLETGAFVITKRKYVTEISRIEGDISVYPVSDEESIDIDDKNDWVLCESIFKRKRIIFRVDGYSSLGMGHIYNCITMAYSLLEHDVLFVTSRKSVEGLRKIKEAKLPYKIIEEEEEVFGIIRDFKPDIWVNDRLNTTTNYIRKLKEIIPRVVTIEDLGAGTKYADAVINALFTEDDLSGINVFNGWRYVCLRDEFQIEQPRKFAEKVSNVMIMFGGTDPSNYTKKLYEIVLQMAPKYPYIKYNFVVGIGYDNEKNNVTTVEEKNVFVFPNAQRVTRYMKEADIAITSQGRAIFEFAAMGVPSIVISQNQRETSHSFASMRHGFINLGLGVNVQSEVIENTLDWLINTTEVRRNMHEIMIKYPLREGIERVKSIILGHAINDI